MSYYKSIDFINRCNETTNLLENFEVKLPPKNSKLNIELENKKYINPENSKLNIEWENKKYMNPKDPEVWGPSFWFILHNGAINYPLHANNICKQRMKQFIYGMEVMIPCEQCSDHATSFIEKNRNNLDNIVSSRNKLFNFFVDFHNEINERYKKPIMSYDEAYRLYSCNVSIKQMVYN
jgi:hypothetical protein